MNIANKEKIVIEVSSPLGIGQMLRNEVLNKMPDKKMVSVSQVCFRWEIQKGIMVIPKTSQKERLRENMVFLALHIQKTR